MHTIATWGTGVAGLAGLVVLSLYSWPAVFAPAKVSALVVLPPDTAAEPISEPIPSEPIPSETIPSETIPSETIPVDGGKPDSSVEPTSATVVDTAENATEDESNEGNLFDPVFFEPKRYDLSAEYEARVATIAGTMREHPRARLVITGFSAPRGGKRYNLYLAKQRARVIRDRLVEAGVSFKRMRAVAVVLSRRESRMSGNEAHRAELSLVKRPGYSN